MVTDEVRLVRNTYTSWLMAMHVMSQLIDDEGKQCNFFKSIYEVGYTMMVEIRKI